MKARLSVVLLLVIGVLSGCENASSPPKKEAGSAPKGPVNPQKEGGIEKKP
jgi:hypothetical protein